MAARIWPTSLVLAPALGLLAFDPPVRVHAAGAAQDTSTMEDQTDLALTVYNSDLALIRDVRTLQLPRGVADLSFMDIAATVNPATVHLRSLSEPSRLGVLEQNYEYDLLEPERLLRKYVGRDVTLVRTRTDAGTSREEAVTATLLSYNSAPVWRINGEIVTGIQADHVRFPELPGNLHARPTLVWALDNTGAAKHRVEASYLASKLAWNADYVLTVDRDEATADLDGWITLTNGSGTTFANASVQFVAGDLHRVREAVDRRLFDLSADNRARAAAPPMVEEAFGDYHLYSLPRKTTIRNNETKQLSLLTASRFPVTKRYVVDGQALYYRDAMHPGAPLKDVVQVRYELTNDPRTGLGLPMPAGVVRVYQADSKGATQFVGEDRIGHTPKGERVALTIGHAFDVVAERRQTDFQKVGSNVYEVEYEVQLRNRKPTAITVEVNEPIGGTWRIQRSTHAWTKTDAWAARFEVAVAAESVATLTYRVRVTY